MKYPPLELSERVFDLRHKLAGFYHVSVVNGTGFNAPRLRFVHLVPKDSYKGAISDGFGCSALGHKLKLHKFLFVDNDETLVELLGLSNCKHWFVALLGFWTPHNPRLQYKFYAGLTGQKVKVLGTLDELVDFVDLQLHYIHNQVHLFGELIKKGLTSHIFTHKLNDKFARVLKIYEHKSVKDSETL